MSAVLNGISAAIAGLAVLFFIVGAAGYSNDSDVIEDVAWITISKNGFDVYYGLQKYLFKYNGYEPSLSYDSDTCTLDSCDHCYKDGMASIALIIIALFFTTAVTCISGVLVTSANSIMQATNSGLALFAAIMGAISLGIFMGDCYNKVYDEVNTDDDYVGSVNLKWGPGSILTLIGVILMFIVAALQMSAIAMGGKTSMAAAGSEMNRA